MAENSENSLRLSPPVEVVEGAQVGGGRRMPSPPPVQTPTRLRTTVKATSKDSGLVREAQTRHGQLLQARSAVEDDPFQAAPPAAGNPSRVQCTSLLFDHIQSSGDSPFPLPKEKARALDVPSVGSDDVSDECAKKQSPPISVDTQLDAAGHKKPPSLFGELVSGNPKEVSAVAKPLSKTARSASLQPLSEDITIHGQAAEPTTSPRTPSHNYFEVEENEDAGSDGDTPRQLPVVDSLPVFTTNEAGMHDDSEMNIDRPETPLPAGHRPREEPLPMLFGNDDGSEAPAVMGRTSLQVNSVMEERFQAIHQSFSELAAQVGLPIHQVVARFSKSFTRNNYGNFWNIYQSYFQAHKVQELVRLGEDDVVTATPTDKMARCYKMFREKYPDTYQEILLTWQDAEALGDVDKTVAQRSQLFFKTAKKIEQQCIAVAKCHGFEAALVMAGSVVNQDSALGFSFTTPGADGFFLQRCRASVDDIIGHFKVHIYNKVSLTTVSQAFDTEDPQEGPSKEAEDERSHTDGCDLVERDDHARVRGRLVAALAKLGCEWVTGKLFPWKNFPSKLAKSGIACHGWPDNVLLPGEDRQPRYKGGSKGISDLTLPECSSLFTALNDTSKSGLRFKFVINPKDLTASRLPVITCAAPALDSPHSYGRRMFANHNIDRKGLQRPVNTAATRIKKQKKQPQSRPIETITILDSDDILEGHPPQKKPLRPDVPSAHNSEPKAVPTAPPQKRQTRPKPEVVLTKRTFRKVSFKSDTSDVSSSSGSEYEPEADKVEAHTKGKEDKLREEGDSSDSDCSLLVSMSGSKTDLSTHAGKKCASGGDPKDKGKGKMQSGGGHLKSHLVRRASKSCVLSSEDEDINIAAEGTASQEILQPQASKSTATDEGCRTTNLGPDSQPEDPLTPSHATRGTPPAASGFTNSAPPTFPATTDVDKPLMEGSCPTSAPSQVSHDIGSAAGKPTPSVLSNQVGQGEGPTFTTAVITPQRPKPRPFVKRAHDSKETDDNDPFSLRKKIRLSPSALNPPTSAVLVTAEEGRNPTEDIVTSKPQEPSAEHQAAFISTPETSCLPVVTREGNGVPQQAVCDPDPSHPIQGHFPVHPSGPSMRGQVSEQTAGPQAGAAVDLYRFQQMPYQGNGGWYGPSGPDPRLQAFPFAPLGGHFGQYRSAEDPHTLLPAHPHIEAARGYNYPMGYGVRGGYYYGPPNPLFHSALPACDGPMPANPNAFPRLPVHPDITCMPPNPTALNGPSEGSGNNK